MGLGARVVHEGFDQPVNLIQLGLELGKADKLNIELLPKPGELVLDHRQHVLTAHLRATDARSPGRTRWPSGSLDALLARLSAFPLRSALALRIRCHLADSLAHNAGVSSLYIGVVKE